MPYPSYPVKSKNVRITNHSYLTCVNQDQSNRMPISSCSFIVKSIMLKIQMM
ncbi:hypothetical protein EVA_08932 [gut metagenome]|uniref:Uncharacterized protein n=1 Tax=gut metagenome TaxID=749906 RepID=J9G7W0_9ZZZZ